MPSLTLHLVFADRALAAAQEAPEPSLHRLSSVSSLRQAFRQGAFGPDLGYFPGGTRLLSDLAHCLHTGDLNRAVLDAARTPEERAFALGWATHVLADRLVHPAVGRATGELLYGTSELFVDGGTEPVAHVRIETGLDAYFSVREVGAVASPACRFGLHSLRFLARAYARTYDVRFSLRSMARSYRALLRSAEPGLRLIRAFGRNGASGGSLTPADALARGTPGRLRRVVPLSVAFLTPLAPPDWLVAHVETALERFGETFLHHARSGLTELGNLNLETGEPEEDVKHHPATAVTRLRLREMRQERAVVESGAPAIPASVGPL